MKETDKMMISAILLVFGWFILGMTMIVIWVEWDFTWLAGRILVIGAIVLLVRNKYFPHTFGHEKS